MRGSPATDRELWTAVDGYICDRLLAPDPVLDAALANAAAAGIPAIAVTANEGKLLELLVRVHGARRVLEMGTLCGYSTIWLARPLPAGGRLVTLEYDPRHAEIASQNIAAAGLADVVDVRVGPALETLPVLAAEGGDPFDLIFIDADKKNYPAYLEWALKLSRPGTLIVIDNVIGGGAILDPDSAEPWGEQGGVAGMRRFYELLGAEPRLTATAIQTVGQTHDGFALALVRDGP